MEFFDWYPWYCATIVLVGGTAFFVKLLQTERRKTRRALADFANAVAGEAIYHEDSA